MGCARSWGRTVEAIRRCQAVAAIIALGIWGMGPAKAEESPQDVQAGRTAYGQSCARCHGLEGRGDGLEAKRFYPRPRDLTLGVYKFRTTASGTPPTDDDIFRTITQGLPGTNMPDWQHLDERLRWQLVSYLKSLSPVFEQGQPVPIAITPDPGPKGADPEAGRALYERLGCASCHGVAGRANGFSASGLVDDWGMPVRPANLTQGWNYRGGGDARSVVTRVLTGIDGAGMPSYAEAISGEEAWQLAYYVTSLQEPAHWNVIIRAAGGGPLPATVDDPRWMAADRAHLRLRNAVDPDGAWVSPPTVDAVAVEVLSDGDSVALRVTWDDPTDSTEPEPDGLAVVLKPQAADGDVVTLQVWPYAGASELDVCYWSARAGQVFETLAADFDGLRAAGAGGAPLQSASHYEDGRRRVVIRRPLHPQQPAGAKRIEPGQLTAVAFAVWDGGNPGARAVSPWVDVVLHPAAASGRRAQDEPTAR